MAVILKPEEAEALSQTFKVGQIVAIDPFIPYGGGYGIITCYKPPFHFEVYDSWKRDEMRLLYVNEFKPLNDSNDHGLAIYQQCEGIQDVIDKKKADLKKWEALQQAVLSQYKNKK